MVACPQHQSSHSCKKRLQPPTRMLLLIHHSHSLAMCGHPAGHAMPATLITTCCMSKYNSMYMHGCWRYGLLPSSICRQATCMQCCCIVSSLETATRAAARTCMSSAPHMAGHQWARRPAPLRSLSQQPLARSGCQGGTAPALQTRCCCQHGPGLQHVRSILGSET